MSEQSPAFFVGWSSADLTPDQAVEIAGQMHIRVSEGIMDPISATVLVCETRDQNQCLARSIMVSCDLVCVSDELHAEIMKALRQSRPDINGYEILLSATHTHTAPNTRLNREWDNDINCDTLQIQDTGDYTRAIAGRIAAAVDEACDNCTPGGISSGIAQATIAYNRRLCYSDGTTQMYGGYHRDDFTHVEAGTDSSVNVMCLWDTDQTLTGLVINLACPSQVSEHLYEISADFWCETRLLLRRHFGNDIHILSQVSAAGDLAPMRAAIVPDWETQKIAWEHKGQTIRDVIAERLSHAAKTVTTATQTDIDWSPVLVSETRHLDLPMRMVTAAEAEAATTELERLSEEYQSAVADIDKTDSRWYIKASRIHRFILRARQVIERYQDQEQHRSLSTSIHGIRMGNAVFISNRFELFLDFGLQIKGRSPATHTFVVQLAGSGTYLPTQRAVAGGGYGAMPASTPVGPEGGLQLVEQSLALIDQIWQQDDAVVQGTV